MPAPSSATPRTMRWAPGASASATTSTMPATASSSGSEVSSGDAIVPPWGHRQLNLHEAGDTRDDVERGKHAQQDEGDVLGVRPAGFDDVGDRDVPLVVVE